MKIKGFIHKQTDINAKGGNERTGAPALCKPLNWDRLIVFFMAMMAERLCYSVTPCALMFTLTFTLKVSSESTIHLFRRCMREEPREHVQTYGEHANSCPSPNQEPQSFHLIYREIVNFT